MNVGIWQSPSRPRSPAANAFTLPPCYKCGTFYEGNRCPACKARTEPIKKALYLYLGGLCSGFCGILLALVTYPPFYDHSLTPYLLPIAMVIPFATMIALEVWDQMERLAILAWLVFVLSGAVLPARAAFYFLNGALDKSPPVEVRTLVSNGYIDNGEDGPSYTLVVSIPWDQKQIETHLTVSRDTYSFAETGDSLRLAIYPGAFKTPWYGQAVLSNGHREIRFKAR
jgi:hypothetical protein